MNPQQLPKIITPKEVGARSAAELHAWVSSERDALLKTLYKQGGILLRGFAFSEPMAQFEAVARVFTSTFITNTRSRAPRTHITGNVFTSTDAAAMMHLHLHTEWAYARHIPRTVFLFCARPSESGGQTPLCDNRTVLGALDPGVLERLGPGARFVQRFRDAHTFGLGLAWQQGFNTDSRDAVERLLDDEGSSYVWGDDGRLEVTTLCRSILPHPVTGEGAFISSAHLYHPAMLPPKQRRAAEKLYPRLEDRPYDVRFADGSPIPDADIHHLVETRRAHKVTFDWEPGDLLMVDNILTSHGREPYKGPREMFVLMGGRISTAL